MHGSLSQSDCVAAIERHAAGFAEAVRGSGGRLDAPVEHCPGWDVADLVRHMIQVHWFWATIVEEGLDAPPEDARRPRHLEDTEDTEALVTAFEAGAARLVRVLGAVDPATVVWTWYPPQQDAAFVIRHQVQEMVGHHFDAAHARGSRIEVDPAVGADCVDEFLLCSTSNENDPPDDDPLPPPLDGRVALRCTDSDASWLVTDGRRPGQVAVAVGGVDDAPTVRGSGGDLLLWLYGRIPLDTSELEAADPGLLTRFRAMSYTD